MAPPPGRQVRPPHRGRGDAALQVRRGPTRRCWPRTVLAAVACSSRRARALLSPAGRRAAGRAPDVSVFGPHAACVRVCVCRTFTCRPYVSTRACTRAPCIHVPRANTAPHTPFSKRGHLCPSSAPALSTEWTVRSWKFRTRMASSWSLPQKSVQTRGRVTLRSHLASLLPPERPAGPRSPRVAGHWGADAEGPCARWSPRHRRVGGQDCRGGGGGTPLLI